MLIVPLQALILLQLLGFVFIPVFIASKVTKYSHRFGDLGKLSPSKTDEFLEKFQTAFDPPPSFSEIYVAIFF